LATEALIAIGRVDQSNKLQFLVQSVRLASLTLIFPFGLTGVCWGLVVGALLGGAVAQRILRRHIGLRFRELAHSCTASLLTGLTSLIPLAILAFANEQSEETFLQFLLGASMMTGLAWLASLKAWRHPFWSEIRNMTIKK
jgi:hypothetical protein